MPVHNTNSLERDGANIHSSVSLTPRDAHAGDLPRYLPHVALYLEDHLILRPVDFGAQQRIPAEEEEEERFTIGRREEAGGRSRYGQGPEQKLKVHQRNQSLHVFRLLANVRTSRLNECVRASARARMQILTFHP